MLRSHFRCLIFGIIFILTFLQLYDFILALFSFVFDAVTDIIVKENLRLIGLL
uniref:Candidate secreted effector n=1 Tax=Meloidogyne incognita TaxID=6306 RepID=A0A914MBS9_MELIC